MPHRDSFSRGIDRLLRLLARLTSTDRLGLSGLIGPQIASAYRSGLA